jgi:hypothetical protein
MTAQISAGPFGTLTARAAIAWSDRIYRKLSSCMRAWSGVPKTLEEIRTGQNDQNHNNADSSAIKIVYVNFFAATTIPQVC